METKIKSLFSSYYYRLREEDIIVKELNKREFAIWEFNSDTLTRHLAFENSLSLKKELIKKVPLHVYYSAAVYEFPSMKQMEAKHLKYVDLIFDIDVDHINTECKKVHDLWICKNCKKISTGFVEKCDLCGSLTIDRKSFVCNECINFAKEEVFKLIDDFLATDLGISKEEILIVFSGNRGYHVHVFNEDFRKIDSKARNMIVDYIKGTSFKLYFHNFLVKNNYKFKGINSFGFSNRLSEKIYEELNKLDEEKLIKLGLNEKKVKLFLNKKQKYLYSLTKYKSDYSFLKILEPLSKDLLNKWISDITVNIDERVTVDMHRLIRLPNSLHGKTALRVCPLSYNELEKFEPYNDAIAITKGSAKVSFKIKREYPKITMKNEEYELNQIEGKEIPIYLALYLYLNGYVTINELFL
jgi:DNA primase small subunit